MLLINNEEVEKLFSMKDCLEALELGYDDLLKGDAVYRPRLDVWMPCEQQPDGYWRWGTMEGASRKIGVFAIRMKSDVCIGLTAIRKKNIACSRAPGAAW
jgi:hypothetical protein